jgi:hypothetical protein
MAYMPIMPQYYCQDNGANQMSKESTNETGTGPDRSQEPSPGCWIEASLWRGNLNPQILERLLRSNAVIIHDVRGGGRFGAHESMAKVVSFFADRGWEIKAMTSFMASVPMGSGIHLYVAMQKGQSDKAIEDPRT